MDVSNLVKAYPAGWPLWQILAKSGVPIRVTAKVLFDDEAKVFIACESNLRGLVAEAPTIDELKKNLDSAARDLLRHYLHEAPRKAPITSLTFAQTCPA